MAAMTAWGISKKQGFYDGLTERKGGVGVKADAVFYIALFLKRLVIILSLLSIIIFIKSKE